ncbi:MAG: hypothetical protein ABH842_01760 [Candidatus Micrarchaeota archaeon]
MKKKKLKKLPKIKSISNIDKEYPICGTTRVWIRKLAKEKSRR